MTRPAIALVALGLLFSGANVASADANPQAAVRHAFKAKFGTTLPTTRRINFEKSKVWHPQQSFTVAGKNGGIAAHGKITMNHIPPYTRITDVKIAKGAPGRFQFGSF